MSGRTPLDPWVDECSQDGDAGEAGLDRSETLFAATCEAMRSKKKKRSGLADAVATSYRGSGPTSRQSRVTNPALAAGDKGIGFEKEGKKASISGRQFENPKKKGGRRPENAGEMRTGVCEEEKREGKGEFDGPTRQMGMTEKGEGQKGDGDERFRWS
jgi:hypothetical protein